MVIGERKPLAEILKMIEPSKKVLIAGCGGCVTVCCSGGEKEVAVLASALNLAIKKEGLKKELDQVTIERQCDREYIEEIGDLCKKYDVVLSMACGAGVNFMNEILPDVITIPALNTNFVGVTEEAGVWAERCASCGNCVLDETGGICPIALCSKTMLNGPCGGSNEGKCEISQDIDCAWAKIVERMQKLGRLEMLETVWEAKDWSASRHGGPRRITREDLMVDKKEEEEPEAVNAK